MSAPIAPVEPAAEPVTDPAGEPNGDQPNGDDPNPRGPQDYEAQIAKLRKENASWRTKYREAEPIVKAHIEAQEAAKTEVQKAVERAEAAERTLSEREQRLTRMELAVAHRISPDDIDLIGSGSREEMEARAVRVAALTASVPPTAPPSDRPVEGLRPGAAPSPPNPADDSYPAAWRPNYLRDKESRSQYGQ